MAQVTFRVVDLAGLAWVDVTYNTANGNAGQVDVANNGSGVFVITAQHLTEPGSPEVITLQPGQSGSRGLPNHLDFEVELDETGEPRLVSSSWRVEAGYS